MTSIKRDTLNGPDDWAWSGVAHLKANASRPGANASVQAIAIMLGFAQDMAAKIGFIGGLQRAHPAPLEITSIHGLGNRVEFDAMRAGLVITCESDMAGDSVSGFGQHTSCHLNLEHMRALRGWLSHAIASIEDAQAAIDVG